MKRFLLFVLVSAACVSLYGQYYPGGVRIRQFDERTIYFDPSYPFGMPSKIVPVRQGMTTDLYMNGLPIPNSYATMLMAELPEAYAAIRRANANLTWMGISAGVGTAGILWTLADLAFLDFEDHDFSWIPGVAGAGLLIVAIPLLRGYNRNIERAAALYNRGMGFAGEVRRPRPYLSLANSGIGVALRF